MSIRNQYYDSILVFWKNHEQGEFLKDNGKLKC
jgi:hypothetical protein